MAGQLKQNNTFAWGSLKKEKRWEKRFPDMRCCAIENHEFYQGDMKTHVLGQQRRRERLGFRVLNLTDDEKLDMLDNTAQLLMGIPVKDYDRIQAEMAAQAQTPNRTTDVSVVDEHDMRGASPL